MDIPGVLSVILRISLSNCPCLHRYPYGYSRISLLKYPCLYRYPYGYPRISLSNYPCLHRYPYGYLRISKDILSKTGARTVRPGYLGIKHSSFWERFSDISIDLGWDDRRCVHGGERVAYPERVRARGWGGFHVAGPPGRRAPLQDPPPARRQRAAQDRHPLGARLRRRRRTQNAALLLVRRHRQYRQSNGKLRIT